MEYKRHKKGFTLIELMIVVVIIGVLTALAIGSYRGLRDKALAAEAQLQCNAIGKCIEALGADTGQWPGHCPAGKSCSDGETYDGGDNEVWLLEFPRSGLLTNDPRYPFSNWNGPYYNEFIKDPWGNDYFFDADYQINGKNYAVVGSFGPNGVGRNSYDEDDVYIVISVKR